MYGVCITHRIPRAWKQRELKQKGRSKHLNNNRRIEINLNERPTSKKEERPKQNLTVMFPRGATPPTINQTHLTSEGGS